MSILCMKMGAVIIVLHVLASDKSVARKADRLWAEEVLSNVSGRKGLLDLLKFGIDSDFAVATMVLTRVQDRSSVDVALHATQVVVP